MKRVIVPVTVGLAFLLLAATAQAAVAPSGPDLLPGQVVGVVGSGNQLSLQIKDGQATRTLKVGDAYTDGWTLTALTNTIATLKKDTQTRLVGLNPSGAIAAAAPAGPPTVVSTTLSASDAKLLQQALDTKYWDGKVNPGLTMAETQQFVAFQMRNRVATPTDGSRPLGAQAILGDDYPAYQALLAKFQQGVYVQNLDAWQRLGPVSVYVPAGSDRTAVFAEAGVLEASKSQGPVDSTGGAVWTVTQPRNPSAPPPATVGPLFTF